MRAAREITGLRRNTILSYGIIKMNTRWHLADENESFTLSMVNIISKFSPKCCCRLLRIFYQNATNSNKINCTEPTHTHETFFHLILIHDQISCFPLFPTDRHFSLLLISDTIHIRPVYNQHTHSV